MDENVYHMEVYFTGRVQGVGFRYQTRQVAMGFEVSGQVKNLPDGRVWLEVEGEQREVLGFITALKDEMSGYIKETEEKASTRPRQIKGFEIAR